MYLEFVYFFGDRMDKHISFVSTCAVECSFDFKLTTLKKRIIHYWPTLDKNCHLNGIAVQSIQQFHSH